MLVWEVKEEGGGGKGWALKPNHQIKAKTEDH